MARERILVVDDSAENREFIVNYILKPNKYEPLEARDGMECMELVRRASPDLILLDLQMPRLDGLGVLEALRRENASIPVILMTFHGSEEIAVEVFRMGVRDYVKKPYTHEEMLKAIEGSLTETRLRREKEALTVRLLNANRELHSRIKELNTLYSVGKSVTALLDPAQLLTRIVEAATIVTSTEQGSVLLLEDNALVVRAVKRRTEAHARPVAEISRDVFAERAARSGTPVVLKPEELAAIRQRNPNGPSAMMFVPMQISNRVIGVIGIEQISQPRAFSDHDVGLLSALGDYAAIAVENARNYHLLEGAKEREKTAIRSAFERYVAPSVVDRVLRATHEMPVGGERRTISVLVAEIRGYAAFAERAAPESVVTLLNEYFALATDVVFAREGTLDKSLGDAVMAIFGAPEAQEDHAYRAVDAAFALQDAAVNLNARRPENERLYFSIGVASGEAVIGNIGTPRALNYTAVGEVVNIARRLEEAADPGQVLLDEILVRRLGDLVEAERLADVPGKGRQAPVAAFALRGLA